MRAEALARDLEERLKVVCGHLNAAHAQLVDVVAEVIEQDAWSGIGVRSPKHWLTWQAGIDPATADKVLRLAAAKVTHPAVTAVFDDGRLSLDQAAVAVTAPVHVDATMAELAPLSTVAQLRIEVRAATPPADPADTGHTDGVGRHLVRPRWPLPPARRARRRPGTRPRCGAARSPRPPLRRRSTHGHHRRRPCRRGGAGPRCGAVGATEPVPHQRVHRPDRRPARHVGGWVPDTRIDPPAPHLRRHDHPDLRRPRPATQCRPDDQRHPRPDPPARARPRQEMSCPVVPQHPPSRHPPHRPPPARRSH